MDIQTGAAARTLGAVLVPTGTDFVTVRLIHPARNRLPRDFIRSGPRRPVIRNAGGATHEGFTTRAGRPDEGHRPLQDG